MKRSAILVMLFSLVLTVALPFVGGSGPSLLRPADAANAENAALPVFATQATAAQPAAAQVTASEGTATGGTTGRPSSTSQTADRVARDIELGAIQRQARLASDSEHLAQNPLPVTQSAGSAARRSALESAGLSCPVVASGPSGSGPGRIAGGGAITGTTTADIASFARQYNSIRVASCLQPVPAENFRYDSCMEDRLIWMAEDPSDDPLSAWGHTGSTRSDGVAGVGCDGNLAGGGGDTGATVATKWWDSNTHRASLYRPTYGGATSGVCIHLAMTHGGVGTTVDEPASFVRAAARWGGC